MSTTRSGYTLSRGNDFPVTVTLSSEHGAVITGRTVTAHLATTLGGAAAGSPTTSAITLTEDTTTPATARVYRGTIDAPVVESVIDLAAAEYWLSVDVDGDALVWERLQVVEYRRAG